jgi:O-antigen ligase
MAISIFYLLIARKGFPKFMITYSIFLVSILLSYSMLYYSLETFIVFTKFLFFYIILLLILSIKWFNDNNNIYKLLRFISLFFILTTLPFLFNIIKPLGVGYDLSGAGYENLHGFVGLFQIPHGASEIMAYSSVTLLFFSVSTTNYWYKLFYLTIATFGVFICLQTYVRTGMFMLLTGIIILYLFKQKSKHFLKIIPFIAIGVFATFGYISKNQALIDRMKGKNIYQKKTSINSMSSGRIDIWESTITSFFEDRDLQIVLFGLGQTELINRNYKRLGNTVFSHNGFLDVLTTSGFVGFFAFLGFLFFWLTTTFRVFNYKDNYRNPMGRLPFTIFMMYISFMMVQGGSLVYGSFFVALSIKFSRNIIRNKQLLNVVDISER